MPPTPSSPLASPSIDRDQVVRWRQALEKGHATWTDAQRSAFLAVLNDHPHLLRQGATPRSQRTFGHTLGEHGEDHWVMLAQTQCPAATPALVDGALRARRIEVAWRLLHAHPDPAAWNVLNDEGQARRWIRNLAYPAELERFKAWAEHGQPSLRRALQRPRGRDHLLIRTIALQNAPLFEALLHLDVPLDETMAGPEHPGSTVAHDLAYANWADGLMVLTRHRPALDLNIRNAAGHTPLLLAARYQRWAAAQALLDAGVDVHTTTKEGKQPLWFVITQGMKTENVVAESLALALLVAGANPDRPEGKTAKASSVSAWMRANRPRAWELLLVQRDTVVLNRTAQAILTGPDGETIAAPVRSRARL